MVIWENVNVTTKKINSEPTYIKNYLIVQHKRKLSMFL